MPKKVGQEAPDFTLPTLADPQKQITLSEVTREHPTLLVFWATWCPACVQEIPVLNQWSEKYRSQGLEILGVNVQESRVELDMFTKRVPIKYPVVLDENGKVADRYGLSGIPVAILVAPGGKIVYFSYSLPQNIGEFISKGAAFE